MLAVKTKQLFIAAVLEIVEKYCGQHCSDQLKALFRERERVLSSRWRTTPGSTPAEDGSIVFREIDFETMFNQLKVRLDTEILNRAFFEIADAARRFGELKKAMRLFQTVANSRSRKTDKSLKASALHHLGDIALFQGDFKIALANERKSLRLYQNLNDRIGTARVQSSLGIIMFMTGNPEGAKKTFEAAREIAKKEKISSVQAMVGYYLGNVYHQLGNYKAADQCFLESLKISQKQNAPDTLASLYYNLAVLRKSTNELKQAGDYYQKSLTLSTKANLAQLKALSYLGQAEIATMSREYDRASVLITTAFQTFSELGDNICIAETYKIYGQVHRGLGKLQLAQSYFESSLQINLEFKNVLNSGESYLELARNFVDMGNTKAAVVNGKKAARHFQKVKAVKKLSEAKEFLGSVGSKI